MFEDDITRLAWAIAAKHFARGQTDPTPMIAEGMRLERERWTSPETNADNQRKTAQS